MSAEKSKFKKSIEQIQEQKMPSRTEMLADVFTMARRDAVTRAPNDRNLLAALLNFQAEIEAIITDFEKQK